MHNNRVFHYFKEQNIINNQYRSMLASPHSQRKDDKGSISAATGSSDLPFLGEMRLKILKKKLERKSIGPGSKAARGKGWFTPRTFITEDPSNLNSTSRNSVSSN